MMQSNAAFIGSKEWHDNRRQGIGGSDCAAALGLSKWRTPYQLYLEKIGEAEPQEETWEMARGKAFEPLLRQHYANETGREISVPKEPVRSDKYPFMTYSPDGLCLSERRLQEFKTAAYGKEWGKVGSDEIPQEYLLQVQHGMIVMDYKICDVTVSVAGNKPKFFMVEADNDLQEMIVEGEAKFWDMVQSRTPPEAISNDDVFKMYSRVNGTSVVISPEIKIALRDLCVIRENIKLFEANKESMEVKIKSFMGAAEMLVDIDNFTNLCTWKQAKGAERVDTKALRARYPEIAAEVTNICETTRRFLIK